MVVLAKRNVMRPSVVRTATGVGVETPPCHADGLRRRSRTVESFGSTGGVVDPQELALGFKVGQFSQSPPHIQAKNTANTEWTLAVCVVIVIAVDVVIDIAVAVRWLC